MLAAALGLGALSTNLSGLLVASLTLVAGLLVYVGQSATTQKRRVYRSLAGIVLLSAISVAIFSAVSYDSAPLPLAATPAVEDQPTAVSVVDIEDVTGVASWVTDIQLDSNSLAGMTPGGALDTSAFVKAGWPFLADAPDGTGRTSIKFTLEATEGPPVRIRDIQIRILSRLTPPSGTIIVQHPQGGSDVEEIGFDLDSDDLSGRVIDRQVTSNHYFDKRQVTVSETEPVTIVASAFTSECRCTFVLVVRLSNDSTLEVGTADAPFEITARVPSYFAAYLHGKETRGAFKACNWPLDC